MPFRVRVRRLLEGVPGGHAVLSVGPLLLGVRYTTLRGTTIDEGLAVQFTGKYRLVRQVLADDPYAGAM